MKLRLLPTVAAALLIACWASSSLACDHDQKTAAAQTKAKAGSTVRLAKGASAVTADHAACPGMAAMASAHAACPSSGAATAVATEKACPSSAMTKSASAAKAAKSGDACCAMKAKGASAVTAEAHPGAVTAAPAGSSCGDHAAGKTAGGAHSGCDWCADMAVCDEELRQIGIETQVVPLKNGVMVLYRATSSRGVEAVQASVTRRGDRLGAIVASGDKAHLCPSCRELRGAMASGKLVRETVNIEGGCLTVMTSDDPKVVARIQALSGIGAGARSKT